jgi:hypothetical protein
MVPPRACAKRALSCEVEEDGRDVSDKWEEETEGNALTG